MTALLSVDRLDARHGLLQAVRGVSLNVARGETLALVGANGAGKTTLLRTIAGAHPDAGGRVVFDGRDLTRVPAHRRAAQGIALVPEGRKLFARMTVEENLLLARAAGRRGAWTIDAVIAAFPNLAARRYARCGTLSGGEQQATAGACGGLTPGRFGGRPGAARADPARSAGPRKSYDRLMVPIMCSAASSCVPMNVRPSSFCTAMYSPVSSASRRCAVAFRARASSSGLAGSHSKRRCGMSAAGSRRVHGIGVSSCVAGPGLPWRAARP